MLFNSFHFLIFFVVVTFLYYALPFKWRWFLLLLASCYFYAVLIPVYLFILFGIIIIDYCAGIFIERSSGKKRKLFLAASIIANIGVLVVFKYHNFFVENINDLLSHLNIHAKPFPLWHLLLPVGLSFHTFQAMSYTIEVYRGNQKPEKHFGIYALYVMFYPQLVAGPIERPQNLLHQFYEKHRPDYSMISSGLKTMLLGFFMKVVVADRLSIYVDYVYTDVNVHSRMALIVASIFYSFQIYCDFAGYSLIAIGAGRVMGVKLSENFQQPYLSSSITDFWRRWHKTLSGWFRDYLYIPLGGNKVSQLRYCFNILVVFILSGLWHGANWTFITWGLLHGIFIILESLINKNRKRKTRVTITAYIYSFTIITFSWILFRSVNLSEAFTFIKRIVSLEVPWQIAGEFDERALLLYSCFGIACVILADIKNEFYSDRHFFLYHKNSLVRMAASVVLMIIIMMLGVFDGGQFIYFQF